MSLEVITVAPAAHASRSGGAGYGGDGGSGLRCHPQGTSGLMLGGWLGWKVCVSLVCIQGGAVVREDCMGIHVMMAGRWRRWEGGWTLG